MPEQVSSDISQAVYETLLYSDVFDYPLTAPEIHRYLTGREAAYEDVCRALRSGPGISRTGEYFTLTGREEIVHLRETRELLSRELIPYALTYGRILGSLPFVRMVALTGSLAVQNVSTEEDFDYMLVTRPGRLWTARAFVLLFGRLTRLARHTICPNIIVTECSLHWGQHDLYSARDLCQMIPIAGMGVYQSLMTANPWVRDFLPNAYDELVTTSRDDKLRNNTSIQNVLEFPLQGRLGDRFERWEMNRKIERFTRQEGFGEETIFDANICQGNFDHHRRWTQKALAARSMSFNRMTSHEHGNTEMRIV